MSDGKLASIIVVLGYTLTVLIVVRNEVQRARQNGTKVKKWAIALFVLWFVLCGGYTVSRFWG